MIFLFLFKLILLRDVVGWELLGEEAKSQFIFRLELLVNLNEVFILDVPYILGRLSNLFQNSVGLFVDFLLRLDFLF